jgi:fido (protein-threonine AMPylation protein)
VLACEEALVAGAFDDCPLDERLLVQFHRLICADLFPEWAGRWRCVDVRVGNLCPPPTLQAVPTDGDRVEGA